MSEGTSLVLIALGAILRFAVTKSISGIDIQTVGVVLLVVGVVGLILSLLYRFAYAAPRRRDAAVERTAVRDRERDPVVRDRDYR